MTSSLRIIVTGLVGLYPLGGVAWDYLQYVIGLARLGHDVYYHEDTWSHPYHPLEQRFASEGEYSAQFLHDFFAHYAPELSERWHYLHLHEESFGMPRAAFDEVAASADLFLNVSGACLLPETLFPRCVTVFLDTDPGYNQIVLSERPAWSKNVEGWAASVLAHDCHFTYAENIHGEDCRVPTLGLAWQTTRMPIVLSLWEGPAGTMPPSSAPWSTVMTWNAFAGPLLYGGREYGSKGAEFEKVIDLPARVAVPLKVALGGQTAPVERLRAHGWQIVDGPSATLTPASYQAWIAASRGELSIAKEVYVALRTGWFSTRSACYLAAGRPVVVQDTGFSAILPTGAGLLAFNTGQEAAAAIEAVEAEPVHHAAAARALAEEHFDSDRVLTELLAHAMDSPSTNQCP